MSQTDPQNTYLTGQHEAVTQHHAWRTAQNSASHLLPHLSSLPSSPPIKFLDIACGSGSITASFSPLLPPSSSITAIDSSPSILIKAQKHAESQGIKNITFQQADVFNLPFKEGEFDVVHVSMLLTHLSEPEKAIKEMLRVTKKGGGVLSLREPDMKAWSYHPYLPGIAKFRDMLNEIQLRNGGHLDAAQRLLSWVLNCGGDVKRDSVRCSASAWCFSTTEERGVWGGSMFDRCVRGEMRDRGFKEGLVSENELEKMRSDWEMWIQDEEGWFAALCGEVLVFL